MTHNAVDLGALFAQDVDEISQLAIGLPSAARKAAIEQVAHGLSNAPDDISIVKCLSFLQVALGSYTTRTVPIGTARLLVESVQPLFAQLGHAVSRRVVLQVLALVYVKARQVTPEIDEPIRAAFKSAKLDQDQNVRTFAKQALSSTGVLQQREVTSAGRVTLGKQVMEIVTMRKPAFAALRKAATPRATTSRSPAKPSRAAAKAQRKSAS
jgi:hypothetical protein